MKKVGLIGGVGPESTIEYYRLIIKRYQSLTKSNELPELMIHSINMTKMLELVFGGQSDELVRFLSIRIDDLVKSGCDIAAIASNTPHIVFDALKTTVDIPLISIVEEACKAMFHQGIKKAGLFGTKSTMMAGFYQQKAEEYGIKIIVPEPEDMDFIHNKYMSELVIKNLVPETKKQLKRIAERLNDQHNMDALILGGTELPLILNENDFREFLVVDTTKIHVGSIVGHMIQ